MNDDPLILDIRDGKAISKASELLYDEMQASPVFAKGRLFPRPEERHREIERIWAYTFPGSHLRIINLAIDYSSGDYYVKFDSLEDKAAFLLRWVD
jgi:hypothetical protein